MHARTLAPSTGGPGERAAANGLPPARQAFARGVPTVARKRSHVRPPGRRVRTVAMHFELARKKTFHTVWGGPRRPRGKPCVTVCVGVGVGWVGGSVGSQSLRSNSRPGSPEGQPVGFVVGANWRSRDQNSGKPQLSRGSAAYENLKTFIPLGESDRASQRCLESPRYFTHPCDANLESKTAGMQLNTVACPCPCPCPCPCRAHAWEASQQAPAEPSHGRAPLSASARVGSFGATWAPVAPVERLLAYGDTTVYSWSERQVVLRGCA